MFPKAFNSNSSFLRTYSNNSQVHCIFFNTINFIFPVPEASVPAKEICIIKKTEQAMDFSLHLVRLRYARNFTHVLLITLYRGILDSCLAFASPSWMYSPCSVIADLIVWVCHLPKLVYGIKLEPTLCQCTPSFVISV